MIASTDSMVHTAVSVERRVVNPFVERLLRSSWHWPLSRRLLVVSYVGRSSGDRFSTPVLYERDGADIVVTTVRSEVVWWTNFRGGHPATLRLEGESVETVGRAITDPERIDPWLAELSRRSRLWRLILRRLDARVARRRSGGDAERPPEHRENGERVESSVAETLVVVRFSPR